MRYYCVRKFLIRAAMTVFGFVFASIVAASAQTCIKSGTEADINRALQGANAAAVLRPGTVFALNNPELGYFAMQDLLATRAAFISRRFRMKKRDVRTLSR